MQRIAESTPSFARKAKEESLHGESVESANLLLRKFIDSTRLNFRGFFGR